jgi:hypothetical protein
MSVFQGAWPRFSMTYTTGMLAVLSDTSVSGTDMAPVLPGLAQVSRHVDEVVWCCCSEVESKKISRLSLAVGVDCKRAWRR